MLYATYLCITNTDTIISNLIIINHTVIKSACKNPLTNFAQSCCIILRKEIMKKDHLYHLDRGVGILIITIVVLNRRRNTGETVIKVTSSIVNQMIPICQIVILTVLTCALIVMGIRTIIEVHAGIYLQMTITVTVIDTKIDMKIHAIIGEIKKEMIGSIGKELRGSDKKAMIKEITSRIIIGIVIILHFRATITEIVIHTIGIDHIRDMTITINPEKEKTIKYVDQSG